jgi:multiple sugar transport system permease protein
VADPAQPAVRGPEEAGPPVQCGRALAWAFMICDLQLFPSTGCCARRCQQQRALRGHGQPASGAASADGFRRVFGLQTGQEAIDAGGAGQPIDFWHYLLNSVIVSSLVTGGQVLFSAMAAYAFARLQWRHRRRSSGSSWPA